MKTHLLQTLALGAACAATGAAHAQSSLTLYGTADAGVLSISNTAVGRPGYIPSPQTSGRQTVYKDGGLGASNWGLRGRDDLGGGWRVNFQFQGNIDTASGNAGGPNSSSGRSLFNQMAMVGIAGPLGEVKLGRQIAPMIFAMASTDVRQVRYFGSPLTALVGMNSASGAFIGHNSNVAFGTVYNDSAIVYTSPIWNNLTLHLGYAADASGGFGKANSQRTAALMYASGGLRLSAFYYNGYGNNLPVATALYGAALGNAEAGSAAAAQAGFSPKANTNRLMSVAGLYKWGAFTVSGGYYWGRNPARAILPGGSASLDMLTLGGAWQIQPNLSLTTGYHRIKDNTNDGHSATQVVVGLDYLLSRRTIAYVQAATIRNKGANMNLSPVYGTPVGANRNVNALMLGMRHTF
ncbi:MAG: porin [Pseudomonadota bacterium]|nr:porin [Pseudomonadota bacterium]